MPNIDKIRIDNVDYDITSKNIYNISDEHIIGIWIDNRPIYRKMFTVQDFSTGEHTISHNIANLDFAIGKGGFGIRNDGKNQVIPNSFNANFDFDIFDISSTTLSYKIGSLFTNSMSFSSITLWIEYTKTTDNPNE